MVTDLFPSGIDTEQLRLKAKALIAEKQAIEEELSNLQLDLQRENVGMSDPLVDSQGFPRSDIDVISVRNTRTNIIRLKNDLKSKVDEVEKALIALHQATSNSYSPSTNSSSSNSSVPPAVVSVATQLPPFARVSSVAPGSPAYLAGLQDGDEIIKFGSLDSRNNSCFDMLPNFVATHENLEFNVDVLRFGELHHLKLTPRGWDGRGLLGCRVLPNTT